MYNTHQYTMILSSLTLLLPLLSSFHLLQDNISVCMLHSTMLRSIIVKGFERVTCKNEGETRNIISAGTPDKLTIVYELEVIPSVSQGFTSVVTEGLLINPAITVKSYHLSVAMVRLS